MLNDDIMILDAYLTIFVWIGNKSNDFEKKGAYRSASQYIEKVNDERDKENVQIVEVEAGKEPPTFTVHFTEWRKDKAQKWLDEDPLKQLRGKFMMGAVKKVEEKKEEASKWLDPATNKFPKEELIDKFPTGVNPGCKEEYLADGEFEALFGMNKAAFRELKKWKQTDLKKKVGLF